MNPEELLYGKTHEWVGVETVDGAKIATVGITAFVVEQLTDLVYLELPEVGRRIEAGESFGEIESVKAVSDLYSPVTGEVLEANSGLPEALDTLSEDPFGAGWLIKVRLTDEAPLEQLIDFAAYQKQCEEEE